MPTRSHLFVLSRMHKQREPEQTSPQLLLSSSCHSSFNKQQRRKWQTTENKSSRQLWKIATHFVQKERCCEFVKNSYSCFSKNVAKPLAYPPATRLEQGLTLNDAWGQAEASQANGVSVKHRSAPSGPASVPLNHAKPASVINLFLWEDNDVRL